ncbi:hypothetical protein [Agromyces larvae]|uniref:Uncharacterized protein n=1 Tax=Agromyces larvae TaxID=2929802 RepID=A0ABY4C0I1_9MICO|nr:hypothetical protein [Agromyces larvae]UOE43937.1 hypothetical protein MTO99_17515 [Agromyces larvae]
MTAAPPPIGLPTPPQPYPAQPPRKPGFGWAMTLAIAVTALPVLFIPVYVAAVFGTIASIAAAQSEVRESIEESVVTDDTDTYTDADTGLSFGAGADLPADLPFDIEVPAGVYASVNDSLTGQDAWTATTETEIGYLGYTNASTGCAVSYDNGSIPDEIDLSLGDQAASHAFIEWMFGTEPDPNSYTSTITHADLLGEPIGSAEAVIEYFTTDATQIAVLARTFSPAGEGVMIYVECPTTEALDATLSGDVATYLVLSLI